jgi:type I restriction-modification system DNA methylase subunit
MSGDYSIRNHASFIWSVADKLRGVYKRSEYGRVILPLVVLRRLDCVLEPTKPAVLERAKQLRGKVENVEPVDVMNERFGLKLGDADQLLFDQFEETWAADEALAAQASANDLENFRLVFDREFIDTVVRRMDTNEEIFKRILDDGDFRRTMLDYYATRLYERLRCQQDQLGLAPAGDSSQEPS